MVKTPAISHLYLDGASTDHYSSTRRKLGSTKSGTDLYVPFPQVLKGSGDNKWFYICYKLLDIIRGLDYMHSQKVVHGDLNGSNVLIDRYGNALLSDFGLSLHLESLVVGLTTSSDVRGNQRFDSPELSAFKRNLTPKTSEEKKIAKTMKSDVWAFGCTAIQVLVNEWPYNEHEDLAEVDQKISKGVPPYPPEKYPDNVNRDCWDLIKSCWRIKPTERPTAGQLYKDIKTLVMGTVEVEDLNNKATETALRLVDTEDWPKDVKRDLECWELIQDMCKRNYTPEPANWVCYTLSIETDTNRGTIACNSQDLPLDMFRNSWRQRENPRFVFTYLPERKKELNLEKDMAYETIRGSILEELGIQVDEKWKLLLVHQAKRVVSKSENDAGHEEERKIEEEKPEEVLCLAMNIGLGHILERFHRQGKRPYFTVRSVSRMPNPVASLQESFGDKISTNVLKPKKEFTRRTSTFAIAIRPRLGEDGEGFLIGQSFQVESDVTKRFEMNVRRLTMAKDRIQVSAQETTLHYGDALRLKVPPFHAIIETRKRNDEPKETIIARSLDKLRVFTAKGKEPLIHHAYEPIDLEYFAEDDVMYGGKAVVDYSPKGAYEVKLIAEERLTIFRCPEQWYYIVKEGGNRGWVPSWTVLRDSDDLPSSSTTAESDALNIVQTLVDVSINGQS
ncbi:hypothetical protein FRC03_003172 [Tulasnella sp. 419]|nr:hypothetical protein FRC03_003172 [Tulasnella sp. 419]